MDLGAGQNSQHPQHTQHPQRHSQHQSPTNTSFQDLVYTELDNVYTGSQSMGGISVSGSSGNVGGPLGGSASMQRPNITSYNLASQQKVSNASPLGGPYGSIGSNHELNTPGGNGSQQGSSMHTGLVGSQAIHSHGHHRQQHPHHQHQHQYGSNPQIQPPTHIQHQHHHQQHGQHQHQHQHHQQSPGLHPMGSHQYFPQAVMPSRATAQQQQQQGMWGSSGGGSGSGHLHRSSPVLVDNTSNTSPSTTTASIGATQQPQQQQHYPPASTSTNTSRSPSHFEPRTSREIESGVNSNSSSNNTSSAQGQSHQHHQPPHHHHHQGSTMVDHPGFAPHMVGALLGGSEHTADLSILSAEQYPHRYGLPMAADHSSQVVSSSSGGITIAATASGKNGSDGVSSAGKRRKRANQGEGDWPRETQQPQPQHHRHLHQQQGETMAPGGASGTRTATTTAIQHNTGKKVVGGGGNSRDSVKQRGRPRLDTRDETAADRRRTQIRLAQRAYRLRKETTISSLRARVAELENAIDGMQTAFLELHDTAAAVVTPQECHPHHSTPKHPSGSQSSTGGESHHPHDSVAAQNLAVALRSVTERFLALAKTAAAKSGEGGSSGEDDGEDGEGESLSGGDNDHNHHRDHGGTASSARTASDVGSRSAPVVAGTGVNQSSMSGGQHLEVGVHGSGGTGGSGVRYLGGAQATGGVTAAQMEQDRVIRGPYDQSTYEPYYLRQGHSPSREARAFANGHQLGELRSLGDSLQEMDTAKHAEPFLHLPNSHNEDDDAVTVGVSGDEIGRVMTFDNVVYATMSLSPPSSSSKPESLSSDSLYARGSSDSHNTTVSPDGRIDFDAQSHQRHHHRHPHYDQDKAPVSIVSSGMSDDLDHGTRSLGDLLLMPGSAARGGTNQTGSGAIGGRGHEVWQSLAIDTESIIPAKRNNELGNSMPWITGRPMPNGHPVSGLCAESTARDPCGVLGSGVAGGGSGSGGEGGNDQHQQPVQMPEQAPVVGTHTPTQTPPRIDDVTNEISTSHSPLFHHTHTSRATKRQRIRSQSPRAAPTSHAPPTQPSHLPRGQYAYSSTAPPKSNALSAISLPPPSSYSWLESSFARRWHRVCLERSYGLVTNYPPDFARAHRAMRFNMLFTDIETVRDQAEMLLARGQNESFSIDTGAMPLEKGDWEMREKRRRALMGLWESEPIESTAAQLVGVDDVSRELISRMTKGGKYLKPNEIEQLCIDMGILLHERDGWASAPLKAGYVEEEELEASEDDNDDGADTPDDPDSSYGDIADEDNIDDRWTSMAMDLGLDIDSAIPARCSGPIKEAVVDHSGVLDAMTDEAMVLANNGNWVTSSTYRDIIRTRGGLSGGGSPEIGGFHVAPSTSTTSVSASSSSDANTTTTTTTTTTRTNTKISVKKRKSAAGNVEVDLNLLTTELLGRTVCIGSVPGVKRKDAIEAIKITIRRSMEVYVN